ncbi:MAG TPA: hypothetical protein DCF33_15390 [Saprospirales bacterium]|nr:hypothetical protein [Saprospirales bacterium]
MTPNLQRISTALCVLLAASAAYFHASEALWNDEIYTLEKFVFKGIGTVLTDYHVPNNHILSNVFYCFWTTITAVDSIGELLEHPWLIRLMPLAFSMITLWLVYRAGIQIGGHSAGWLSVLVLLSGVTFQAYAFQVRGYALSMTASAAISALILQWAAGKPLARLQQLGLALSVLVLLYTLPSNLYFWAAAIGSCVITQAVFSRTEGIKAFLLLFGLLVAGAALAVVAYLPVMDQMQNSEYFAAGKSFQGEHFQKFGLVFSHFFSGRWLLLPVLIAGTYLGWRQGNVLRKQFGWLYLVLLLPFLFSALRGDMPPERIYLVLLPVFSLLVAASIHVSFSQLQASYKTLAYSLLLLYSAFSYGLGVYQVRKYLREGMDQENHYYPGLNHNYYQHYFNPNAEYDLFRKKFGTNQQLILESSEQHDMPVYLQHKKQAFVPLDSIGSYLQKRQKIYVSSNYAKAFMREMSKMKTSWNCRYMQNEPRLPRIIVCEPVAGQ